MFNYGVIKIPGGEQAAKFLQGQVTCDVREVTEQQSCLGAHCDPKGRVQFIFRLSKQGDGYYLQLLQELIPHAMNCLQKYAMLFRIKLQAEEGGGEHPRLQNIIDGIPTIYPETIGLFTPHQINLPLIGGVSFTKGCYTGQEIIARMQYLGKLKQQMYRVNFTSAENFIPGTKFYNEQGQEVGELVDAVFESEAQQQQQALAVLQNNAITQAIHLENPTGPLVTILNLPYTPASF